MAEREDAKPKMSDRVELDDAYLGGERSGGKRGRGAAGKTPFVAAVETTHDRKPRRIKLQPVKGFRKKEVEKLAKSSFEAGTNIVSDGLSCWQAVTTAGCDHFPMRTGQGRQAARWAPFTLRWLLPTLASRTEPPPAGAAGSTRCSATSRPHSPEPITMSAPSMPQHISPASPGASTDATISTASPNASSGPAYNACPSPIDSLSPDEKCE